MRDVDAQMWNLYKNGVIPKDFFEKADVKQSLKSLVEQHEENKLLDQTKTLADKYMKKIQKERDQKKTLENNVNAKSMSEKNLEIEKLKRKLNLDLTLNKPARLVKDSWKQ